jgi:ATP-dependent DNA ligase
MLLKGYARTIDLRSRNDNDFGSRYGEALRGLAGLRPETVVDGEVVALDESERPSFSLLQNYASGDAPLVFFVFDVMMFRGRDPMGQTLEARREVLEQKVLPTLRAPGAIRRAPLDPPISSLIHAVKTQALEGSSPGGETAATKPDCARAHG